MYKYKYSREGKWLQLVWLQFNQKTEDYGLNEQGWQRVLLWRLIGQSPISIPTAGSRRWVVPWIWQPFSLSQEAHRQAKSPQPLPHPALVATSTSALWVCLHITHTPQWAAWTPESSLWTAQWKHLCMVVLCSHHFLFLMSHMDINWCLSPSRQPTWHQSGPVLPWDSSTAMGYRNWRVLPWGSCPSTFTAQVMGALRETPSVAKVSPPYLAKLCSHFENCSYTLLDAMTLLFPKANFWLCLHECK